MRLAICLLALIAVTLAQTTCQMTGSSNPYNNIMSNQTIPWYDIDLDAPPLQRWQNIVTIFNQSMWAVTNSIVANKPIIDDLLKALDKDMPGYYQRINPEYAAEVKALAQLAGWEESLAFIFQIMYEVIGLCTSIVAQDAQGNIIHGRNLDFGLFMGWDSKNNTWMLTELLRPTLYNARWKKGGQVVFVSTQYAGYLGVHTGSKPGKFGITVDSRFDNNLDKYLLEWLTGSYNASFLTLRVRETLETQQSYADAFNALQASEMVGPSYIIMSGINAGEGAVLSYAPGKTGPIDTWTLQSQLANRSYYVIETNYDHWEAPPFFDDRRTAAKDCLDRVVTQSGATLQNLYWLLSVGPSNNRLTTFTTLMNNKAGTYEAYKQRCWDVSWCQIW